MQVLVLDGAPWEEGIPKRHVKLTSSKLPVKQLQWSGGWRKYNTL